MAENNKDKTSSDTKKKKTTTKKTPSKATSTPKKYSFTQWASKRGVPTHHRGGMKAFVARPSRPRTMEEWDVCFENY